MFYIAKVSSIERLTSDAINLEFTLDLKDTTHFNYKAGQYIVIRIPALNPAEHRSYSLSAAPDEHKLQIGVKRQMNGLVSTYLCDKIALGDLVELMIPQGSFTLQETRTYAKIVAFAAGSGITPILAIIKDQLKKSNASIHLFYGNRDASAVMYKDQLSHLIHDYPTRCEVTYVYSQEKVGLVDLEGRIDSNKINRWKEYQFSLSATNAFLLCGPGDMVQSVQDALLKNGVAQEKILTEYFTSPSESSETPKIEFKPSVASSGFNVRIKFEGKQYDLQSANNKSVILNMGMKQGIDLPYSCKSGVCSTCQAKLISGEVKMDNNYVLSDAELNQGFILTCQSHPITSIVEVDYDMK